MQLRFLPMILIYLYLLLINIIFKYDAKHIITLFSVSIFSFSSAACEDVLFLSESLDLSKNALIRLIEGLKENYRI